VITTLQIPDDVVLGIAKVASIWVAESHVTLDAVMVEEPECVSFTVGVETKPAPLMTDVIESPASPLSGLISLKDGLGAVVVVAVATVVAFVVTTVVGTGVGADVGIDETVTWVILILYTFSIVERGYCSVFEFTRYPQVPSVFL
jgi:hypothetical protein